MRTVEHSQTLFPLIDTLPAQGLKMERARFRPSRYVQEDGKSNKRIVENSANRSKILTNANLTKTQASTNMKDGVRKKTKEAKPKEEKTLKEEKDVGVVLGGVGQGAGGDAEGEEVRESSKEEEAFEVESKETTAVELFYDSALRVYSFL